jgi:hypothetical protein
MSLFTSVSNVSPAANFLPSFGWKTTRLYDQNDDSEFIQHRNWLTLD